MMKRIIRNNFILKLLSVILIAGPPLGYLIGMSNLFGYEVVREGVVEIGLNFIKSLQGLLSGVVLLMAIIYIYRPPKVLVVALLLGSIMIFASKLFHIFGIALLLFATGVLVNKLLLSKIIERNELLRTARLNEQVRKIMEE